MSEKNFYKVLERIRNAPSPGKLGKETSEHAGGIIDTIGKKGSVDERITEDNEGMQWRSVRGIIQIKVIAWTAPIVGMSDDFVKGKEVPDVLSGRSGQSIAEPIELCDPFREADAEAEFGGLNCGRGCRGIWSRAKTNKLFE